MTGNIHTCGNNGDVTMGFSSGGFLNLFIYQGVKYSHFNVNWVTCHIIMKRFLSFVRTLLTEVLLFVLWSCCKTSPDP